jgi:outer membrane protein OmpA-like peptidoglycan-associated protein
LIVGVAVAGIGIAGCASGPPPPIGFNYQVDNGPANRIVQVFDLAGNTIVQVRNMDAKTTHFYNAGNVEIPHTILGENVVLTGLQSSFTVSSPLAASRIVRTVPAPALATPLAPASPVVAVGPVAADQVPDEKLVAEITRIKKEIADLKKLLAAANDLPSVNAQATIAPHDPQPAEPLSQSEIIRVTFHDNSQSFSPPHEIRANIVERAKSAKSVEVRGFTDSDQSTPRSEALAKGRAEAAKRYLVRRGVDGKKIRTEYESAGKFITDNATAQGKAANRRVEIRLS